MYPLTRILSVVLTGVTAAGLVPLREGDVEDVPASLEVDLLAEIRKQIILLLDGKVKFKSVALTIVELRWSEGIS